MILAQRWECEHSLCTAWATTYNATVPHHLCRYGGGLMLPLVRAESSDRVQLVERQDRVGDEQPQIDVNTRPVQAAERVRDDGVDTTVYAPTARATAADRADARHTAGEAERGREPDA